MTTITTLDNEALMAVKQGFVPMPGGRAEPVAGAGMMTAAQVAPMGDPAMAGEAPPMDPSMMGGAPPMDPSMMGGMDPSALAGALGGEMGPADGQVTIPFSQLLDLIALLTDGSVAKAKAGGGAEGGEVAPWMEAAAVAKPKKPSNSQMIQEIHAALTGGGATHAGGGMPTGGM